MADLAETGFSTIINPKGKISGTDFLIIACTYSNLLNNLSTRYYFSPLAIISLLFQHLLPLLPHFPLPRSFIHHFPFPISLSSLFPSPFSISIPISIPILFPSLHSIPFLPQLLILFHRSLSLSINLYLYQSLSLSFS